MSILKKRQILKISSWENDASEFVHRVNDKVRKRQKRISNVAGEGEERSTIWRLYSSDDGIMGENYQDNQNSIMNTSDLTLKKMFGISATLVSEQDEIFKVDTISLEKHSWKYLSSIGAERIINLQRTKVYGLFRILCCVLEESINIRSPTKLEEKDRKDHNFTKLQRL